MNDRTKLRTVGELIRELSVFHEDDEVDFSGLDFYRFKKRGAKLIQAEFGQQVYRNSSGKVVVENLD